MKSSRANHTNVTHGVSCRIRQNISTQSKQKLANLVFVVEEEYYSVTQALPERNFSRYRKIRGHTLYTCWENSECFLSSEGSLWPSSWARILSIQPVPKISVFLGFRYASQTVIVFLAFSCNGTPVNRWNVSISFNCAKMFLNSEKITK